jgi:hypothetical protein
MARAEVTLFPQRMRIGSLDLFGYIDSAGRVRIAPRFDKAGEFSEGLCVTGSSIRRGIG